MLSDLTDLHVAVITPKYDQQAAAKPEDPSQERRKASRFFVSLSAISMYQHPRHTVSFILRLSNQRLNE